MKDHARHCCQRWLKRFEACPSGNFLVDARIAHCHVVQTTCQTHRELDMPLITLKDASLAYGHWALLDHAELQLDPRERVVLIGRNGSGKTTLFRLLSGETEIGRAS